MGITGMKAVDNNRRPSKSSAKSSYAQSVEKSRKVQNVEQMSTSPREKVLSVMNSVMGVTDEECHAENNEYDSIVYHPEE
jgi:ribosome-binding protein aMBF1 (putative translation factor)